MSFSKYASVRSIAIALLIMFVNEQCCAGLVDLRAWTHEYNDGQYILVLVPSNEEYKQEWEQFEQAGTWKTEWPKTEEAKQAARLRSLYAKNGLYKNNDTYKLIWEFPRWTYSYPHLSKNGRFAVFPGDWSTDSTTSNPGWRANVVDFVVDGKLIASYNYSDLIQFTRLKSLVTQQYPSCALETFDPGNLTYTIETEWGERIVFDVTTGAIIAHHRPIELAMSFLMLILATAVVGLILWRGRRKKYPLNQ